jgi:heme o synthase
MHLQETKAIVVGRGSIKDYLELIKPRETSLLAFIGLITFLAAGNGPLTDGKVLVFLAALMTASAGANGLTNYLDREIDARMERTKRRALPSGKISPAERALYFTAGLAVGGLILAWYLHPYVFLADLVGTSAALIYRKKVTCVFPQGMIASCTPIMMGWFAVRTSVSWELWLLCALIALWLPAHIWSVMIAHRDEYREAGIKYFPINHSVKSVSRILLAFCVSLYLAAIGLYFIGHFGWFYLIIANLGGIAMTYASFRLMKTNASRNAWQMYKLSAFPYLGLIFLAIGLDIWLR